MARARIGELLVAQGAIDVLQLASALSYQQRWGGRLGRSLVAMGFLPEEAVLATVGAQLGVPVIEIGDRVVPPAVLRLLPQRVIRTRRVLPLGRLGVARGGAVVIATSDPFDLPALDELAFTVGRSVRPVLAAEEDLDRAIARLLDGVLLPRPGFRHRSDALELPEDDRRPVTLIHHGGGELVLQ
jgi:type IV pilus assembly protein PilB